MDARKARMDTEFDQLLVEIKPFVLQLYHKAERQRCALWIKKLCDPFSSSSECKNRNVYAKLLLHMLKRNLLDGPFAVPPEKGHLKPLPSYMSIFFNDHTFMPKHTQTAEEISTDNSCFIATETPAWVQSELENSMTYLGGETSTKENIDPEDSRRIYNTSSPKQPRLKLSKANDSSGKSGHISPIGEPWDIQTNASLKGPSTFRDEASLIRMHEKELEMKTKVLQAQFHEEKLKLQHMHDIAVQKILDRKNSEIEELKVHYQSKDRGHDETAEKSEKRIQSLMREIQMLRESKDRQIDELKTMLDETTEAAKSEYEAKVQEALGTFERDKYELQKTHTKNIQQLLDDTNQRLMKMEEEYNAQTAATKIVISELEGRVLQLTQETESSSIAKQSLVNEKHETDMKFDITVKQLKQLEKKYISLEKEFKSEKEDHDLQIKSLINKYDANSEFLKQESNLSLNKAQETARELEDQLQNLKHSLQDSEQQRVRELRERESLHQQDMMSIQHLHEKQLHQLRTEWDQDKSHHAREMRSLEDIIRERDEQITRLTVQQKQNTQQAGQAIEDYKKQVSEAQQKVYCDMQSQIEKVESDLQCSKRQHEKLKEDFNMQIEEMKTKHHEELAEMQVKCGHDKANLTKQSIQDRDILSQTYEKQLEDSERRLRDALEEQDRIADERKKQHSETFTSMEAQIRELREELVSANALRRQQLVELGLLREEERQKAARENDGIVNRLEGEIDRQRLEMHRQNAAELDRQAQKDQKDLLLRNLTPDSTKVRLESLENDYKQRLERAYDRISELQQRENNLRDELSKVHAESEHQMVEEASRRDEESRKLRLQLESANIALLAEIESERERFHSVQRQSQKSEYDHKDKVASLKIEYEDRMKGLLPVSLKNDMEDTIHCLRSQVSSLQQRVNVLQQEIDENNKSFPLSGRNSSMSARQLT